MAGFYDTYIAPAWSTAQSWYGTAKGYYNEFSAGWEYGDEDPGSGSWAYLAGDYLEGAYSAAKGVYGAYKGFIDKDDPGRPLPTPGKVGGVSSSYNAGSFQASKADFTKMGYSDPRVQAAMSRAASSNIPSIAATVQRVGLTTRSGQRTIGLPTSSISVRSSTRSA